MIIQRLHLDCLNKDFSHVGQSKALEYSLVSSYTFNLALPAPVAFLEPRLGGRILGPMEPKALARNVNTHCNSSYFLMKMDDINPFSKHDKTKAQPDNHQNETIPLTLGGVIGEKSTWEPEREQETPFRSLRTKVLREHVKGLY